MGRVTENLSSQVDGVQSTFTTTFQRTIGTSVVSHNEDKVLEAQVTEPNSKQIALGFVPAVNDEIHIVYDTDETVDGRVQGFSEDPTVTPPPALPQGLVEILEDLNARIDQIESDVEQPPDPKDSVHVATLADLGATYDDAGGTGGNGAFSAAPLVVDGVTLLTGFRVLVKDQAGGDENGIYVVLVPGTGSDGAWERAPDFIEGANTQVTEGARFFVSRGTQKGRAFLLATPDPITVGGASGTSLTFDQTAGSHDLLNVGPATAAVSSGDLAAGTDFFYEESTKNLFVGPVVIGAVFAADYACFRETATFSGTGFHGTQIFATDAPNTPGARGGDIYLVPGKNLNSFDGPAGVLAFCGSVGVGPVAAATSFFAGANRGPSSDGFRGGQMELEGGFHTRTGAFGFATVTRGGDLLLRGGGADGATSATGGNTVLEGGMALGGGTDVTGSILIGTGYTSFPSTNFVDTLLWFGPFNTSQPTPNIVLGVASTDVDVPGVLAVGGDVGFFGASAAGQVADSVALTDSTLGSVTNTIGALTDPVDAPATADALRDDLVTNLIPELRDGLASLTAKYNVLRGFAQAHGLMAP